MAKVPFLTNNMEHTCYSVCDSTEGAAVKGAAMLPLRQSTYDVLSYGTSTYACAWHKQSGT